MGIGRTLSQLLEQQGLKVTELAELSGVSKNTIYGIIRRDNMKASINSLLKICDVLNVDPEIFYDDWLEAKRNVESKNASTDLRLQRLTDNYNRLNDTGKGKLVSYSDDLAANPANTETSHIYKIAARDGGVKEVELSDDQFREITDAPDWSDEK